MSQEHEIKNMDDEEKRVIDLIFHLVVGRRVLKVVKTEALLCKQDFGGRYPSSLRHPEQTQALAECSLPAACHLHEEIDAEVVQLSASQ